MEKVKALFKSRRFWTAIGGVVVVAAQETLGLEIYFPYITTIINIYML